MTVRHIKYMTNFTNILHNNHHVNGMKPSVNSMASTNTPLRKSFTRVIESCMHTILDLVSVLAVMT